MKTWPTLYKKTSTGKIQEYTISVEGSTITKRFGQTGGKIQVAIDVIKKGKNIGKANETTPEEQALSEAQSKWEEKKKKSYVEKIDDAEAGKVAKEFVEGGYNPMLAKSFSKDSKKIVYPCATQPKLDGSRCLTTNGKLWTRSRKTIISVPHIEAAVAAIKEEFPVLDGELYNHSYKDKFEDLMHLIRQQKTPDENHGVVEYHVYDVPSDKPFSERMEDLKRLKELVGEDSPIKVLETVEVGSEEDLTAQYDKWIEEGYEGSMARNMASPYEYKRSANLQKIKPSEDAEYKIIGMEEGRGKLAGHCAAFVCVTEEGSQFKAKLKGSLDNLKKIWGEGPEKYNGKMLTVQFMGITNRENVPRFPVGLRIREEA